MTRLPHAVRKIGASLLSPIPVRIRDGPNAGLRWSLASAGRGYRSGRFEPERVESIIRLLRADDRVWDIGAHKGYVTLAAARVVEGEGQVVAVEPAPANRALLRRHLSWNGFDDVRVVAAAMGEEDGRTTIEGAGSSLSFQTGRGDEVVPLRALDSLVQRDGLPPPTVLKIDVEGSEAAVLRGGAGQIAPDALVWISVHGRARYRECREIMEEKGFRIFESAVLAALTRSPGQDWKGDREMLAVGPGRDLADAEIEALPLFRS